MSDHLTRLQSALNSYPNDYSTDDMGRRVVRVRADDLRMLLGDLNAYRKTIERIIEAEAHGQ